MVTRIIDSYEKFLNKQVVIYYYDSPEHVTRQDGIIISCIGEAIIISKENKEQLIPKARIVRIELREKDGDNN